MRFFLLLCCLSTLCQAQDCQKAWMHYDRRVQLHKITIDQHGVEVPVDKIQIDFLGAPVGIPYQYARRLYIAAKDTVCVDGEYCLHGEAYKAWEALRQAAASASITLQLRSAYRDTLLQANFYRRFGASKAEPPGFSEHHLFTAVDIKWVNSHNAKFRWLMQHAFDYGWVPSYYFRIDKKVQQEPWHWRYVGKLAAKKFRCVWEKEVEREISKLLKQ